MEDNYLMYATNRSNKFQTREHFSNRALEGEMSETALTESDVESTQRGTRHTTRARLDSYEQAHVSREMLQQMQESYRRRSHNDLFLDETSLMKRKRVVWAMCGIIIILLLLLILILGTIAGVGFIVWKSQLAFPLSLALTGTGTAFTESFASIDTEQIHQFINETYITLDDHSILLQHLLEITNFATIEYLSDRLNQLIAVTQSNFSMVNKALNSQVLRLEDNQLSINTRLNNLEDNLLMTNNQLNTLENNVSTTDTQLDTLEGKLRLAQNNITSVNNQANSLQASVNTISNRMSSPVNLYQNCRQDTTACNITSFRDTRLYCSTSALIINLQVRNNYIIDVATI